jgi:acetyltransferase-like isoleucine patch superfamily enzyme
MAKRRAARDPALDRLQTEARQVLHRLREQVRTKWNRDLPLEELLSDRWERARKLRFGEGASVHQSSYVYGDVAVGPNTWVGPFTLLDGSGGLRIGGYCSISAGVQIYTHDSVRWALSRGASPYERAAVEIGDCCHIGSHTVVLKGVTIGEHSVVGACSLVNTDIPPYTVAFGVPCTPAGRVEIGPGGAIRFVGRRRPAAGRRRPRR